MTEYNKARELLSNYLEILNEKEQMEKNLKEIKSELEQFFIDSKEKKLGFEGLGIIQMTSETTIVSYDKKAIDKIKDDALRNGDIHTANALANAQKTEIRSGSMRITKDKIA
jgi:hypothetical protein